ncbi:MAG TPA: hypothetical protein VMU20_17075 [Candidatus Dormibacteraeota bacterium]|nr:hypothetical protein [Candidatus Dormibacteraeota bacterium]
MSTPIKMARAVLLAFADLGIYLPSSRERLIRKARWLEPMDTPEIDQFIDLCIEAELLAPEEAGQLQLSAEQARRLARSLDGHTPVPDDQAQAWAAEVGGAPA